MRFCGILRDFVRIPRDSLAFYGILEVDWELITASVCVCVCLSQCVVVFVMKSIFHTSGKSSAQT